MLADMYVSNAISSLYILRYLRLNNFSYDSLIELYAECFRNEKETPQIIAKGSAYLSKYELPVIVVWSMAPFLPTDVICYLAGTARVNVGKFVLGVLVGEGIICAVYIFGASVLFHAIVGA